MVCVVGFVVVPSPGQVTPLSHSNVKTPKPISSSVKATNLPSGRMRPYSLAEVSTLLLLSEGFEIIGVRHSN